GSLVIGLLPHSVSSVLRCKVVISPCLLRDEWPCLLTVVNVLVCPSNYLSFTRRKSRMFRQESGHFIMNVLFIKTHRVGQIEWIIVTVAVEIVIAGVEQLRVFAH